MLPHSSEKFPWLKNNRSQGEKNCTWKLNKMKNSSEKKKQKILKKNKSQIDACEQKTTIENALFSNNVFLLFSNFERENFTMQSY